MSILVHDCDDAFKFPYNPLDFSWLQKKNSFQWNLDSCLNVETLFKMATREFNHECTT
jgi:hypothetical protein